MAGIAAEIVRALDEVESLDDDRILRTFLALIEATTRTTVFRTPTTDARPTLAFKLDPSRVPDLPLPRPEFEIWVYSPTVEGVHLRGGPIAQGGLRWSDRREDFRTEVLGLMKAQMVKNAVIVPTGAKGGFVVKRSPADPAARAPEVVACYRAFVAALLELTDNIVGGVVVTSPGVVRHDDDDPYLVVAADKGTATFSDLANSVAAEYGFWLGDAFASGGSQVMTTKRSAITARGAWETCAPSLSELGGDGRRSPSPSSVSATCRVTCSATACCQQQSAARSGVRPPSRIPRSRSRSRPLRFAERKALVRTGGFYGTTTTAR